MIYQQNILFKIHFFRGFYLKNIYFFILDVFYGSGYNEKNLIWYIFFNPFNPLYILQFVFLCFFVGLLLAQGYFAKKSFARKMFKCVYLSLFIITKLFLKSETLLLFKLNKLMVAVVKLDATKAFLEALAVDLLGCSRPRCNIGLDFSNITNSLIVSLKEGVFVLKKK